VIGVARTFYVDLLLDEQTNVAVDDQTAAGVLAAHLVPRAAELIRADERGSNLLARIDLLRRMLPEHPWPVLEGEELRSILADACRGKRSAGEVGGGAIASAIANRLPYPLDRLLDQHAPETVEVPTGNRIRLRYTAGQPPVLAVRLQELFGLAQTPRVAAGRVAVKLELLGPNYRPVQVTDDLASFWKNTYPQVRKDLRARYPKHSWPEDPRTAPPQAKGGRRRA
jgi:ATP-dependent helicase HrpB